jgi:hypothetical protein
LQAIGILSAGAVVGSSRASASDHNDNHGDPDDRIKVYADVVDGLSVTARDLDGEIHVAACEGSTLPDKLENAIANLSGYDDRGRIRIGPKPDGTPWLWDRALTIKPTDGSGIHIDVDDTVEIVCTVEKAATNGDGDDFVLTCDGKQQYNDGFNAGDNFRLDGGVWINEAADPAGLFNVRDMQKSRWEPQFVKGFTNSAGDAAVWNLENVDGYCELNRLQHCNAKTVDRGVDTWPASTIDDSGPDATPSFHSIRVADCIFAGCQDFGVRLRGKTANGRLDQVTCFAGAKDFVGFVWAGNHKGTVCTAAKVEDAGSTNYANVVGMRTTSDMNHLTPPLIIGETLNNVDDTYDEASSQQKLMGLRGFASDGNTALKIGPLEGPSLDVSRWGRIKRLGGFWTGDAVSFHDGVDLTGEAVNNTMGVVHSQRGDPDASELNPGQVMLYNYGGDLRYAINDGGTVKTTTIVDANDL